MAHRRAAWVLGLVVGLAASPEAPAYEFEVRAQTVGQGYQLRSFRLLGSDLLLNRRRFTQTLSLNIWNFGRPRGPVNVWDTRLERGPRLYFTTYMRLDHDFGAWTTGSLVHNNRRVDAVDLVPELEAGSLNLDVLYGYFAAEGILDDRIDVYVGRQLDIDTLDWFSMDGIKVRAHTPWRFSVEGFAGLRVRDDSPLGSATQEPDGTSGGECAEYVEGPTPGTGAWRPIDREVTGRQNPFVNDFDFCPQRSQLMPTFGAAVETRGMPVWARVAYRRSQSQTVGIVGPVDRFEHPDTGLYPDELGQAPRWGVNEERLAASVRSIHRFDRGRGRVSPYAQLRYSLLHGLLDEWHGGVRLRYRSHSLEPEIFYSFPTFDGDSIFNVFSSEPYTDARVTYGFHRAGSRFQTYLRGWLRRYHTEDAGEAAMGVALEPTATAAGVHAGLRYLDRTRLMGRIDLFHEDGYGGRRTGGYLSARWRASDQLGLSGRVTVIDFEDGLLTDFRGVTAGAQLGATYLVNRGIALHLIAEENSNRFAPHQLRLIGVIDLAFHPEL